MPCCFYQLSIDLLFSGYYGDLFVDAYSLFKKRKNSDKSIKAPFKYYVIKGGPPPLRKNDYAGFFLITGGTPLPFHHHHNFGNGYNCPSETFISLSE